MITRHERAVMARGRILLLPSMIVLFLYIRSLVAVVDEARPGECVIINFYDGRRVVICGATQTPLVLLYHHYCAYPLSSSTVQGCLTAKWTGRRNIGQGKRRFK